MNQSANEKSLAYQLEQAGLRCKGNDLGGLFQWALLHIQSQEEALQDACELAEKFRIDADAMRAALVQTKDAMETALKALRDALTPEIDLSRDFVSHINLMAAHGDPDYLKPNGMSVRHIDCRDEKSVHRKKKVAA